MADTSLVRSELAPARLATGYTLGSGGPRAVTDYEVITVGAAAASSTPRDMARYVAALLGGGTNQHGSVLQPATLAAMFEPHYQPDPRIPGMGLAFFRGNAGGHPVVEHQGIVPGFNSQIVLAPGDGVGVLAFTNGARQAVLWLSAETAGLLHHLLGVPDEAIRSDVPHHPEIWGDLCGWYQLPGPLSDARVRGALGAGAEVFTRRGRLIFRFLTPVPAMYRGLVLHPDDANDPYVFRIDLGPTTSRVVFSGEPGAGITAAHLELMPLSLHKQPATTNPRRWATGALGALAVASHGDGRSAASQAIQGGSEMTVLVTAASKHGATEEIAERIGAVLAAHGIEVDVKKLQEVSALGGYQAVVLGSGIYLGKWLKEARRFVEVTRPSLPSGRPGCSPAAPSWAIPRSATTPTPWGPGWSSGWSRRPRRASSRCLPGSWTWASWAWPSGRRCAWPMPARATTATGRRSMPGQPRSPASSSRAASAPAALRHAPEPAGGRRGA